MSDPFVGEIKIFSGDFAPRGWAFCDGRMLATYEHNILFSLIGTTYGGDGRTTFALPDLRGRAPIHAGDGPGLTPRRLGSRSSINGSKQTDGEQQAFLAVHYIIALNGVYPSRN
jgi:microcystin-dependent protein